MAWVGLQLVYMWWVGLYQDLGRWVGLQQSWDRWDIHTGFRSKTYMWKQIILQDNIKFDLEEAGF